MKFEVSKNYFIIWNLPVLVVSPVSVVVVTILLLLVVVVVVDVLAVDMTSEEVCSTSVNAVEDSVDVSSAIANDVLFKKLR